MSEPSLVVMAVCDTAPHAALVAAFMSASVACDDDAGAGWLLDEDAPATGSWRLWHRVATDA